MKSSNIRPLPAILLASAALLASSQLMALADDRNQPVQIQADSADRNGKTGLTEYRGAVDIRQGSTHIQADTVTLKTDAAGELETIVATGRPAHFEQKQSNTGEPINGQASHITAQMHTDIVVLENDAVLTQKSGTISGERIEYDMHSERVNARGAASGSKRLTVIIPPAGKAGKAAESRINDTLPASGTAPASEGNTPAGEEPATPAAAPTSPAPQPATPAAGSSEPLAPLASENVAAPAASATDRNDTGSAQEAQAPATTETPAKKTPPRIGRTGANKQ